ncbi:DUF1176 domain-containing protein [Sphingomonas yunnanensis]|uniref:DUF1176 domain-containing protein n=1 Tax=Sphingomonas yunnanensis TaxID=310400 RepID=UPI001CA6FC75|nr:DUF1176 domain-containing protein [Sphingomonas yunnanensis]MBY9064448.1 DUF1176 domain-containing protein [Sphingomonas yunnanensis]
MASLLAALLLQATAPAAPATHGDWILGCDNQHACEALVRESGGSEPRLRLVLRREGMAMAPARLDVSLPVSVAAASRVTLAVDGRPLAQLIAPGSGGGLALPFEGRLAAALLRGRRVTLFASKRHVLAGASLAGLGATLRAMDAGQGREGSAAAIAAVPPLPIVDQPEVTGEAPRRFSARDARKLLGRAAADCAAARTWRLDTAHTLLALDPDCAATHGLAALYLLPPKGPAIAATTDRAPAATPPSWDPARRRLVSAPGLLRQEYAWDGARFRLVLEQHDAALPDASGDEDVITTWRAAVAVH